VGSERGSNGYRESRVEKENGEEEDEEMKKGDRKSQVKAVQRGHGCALGTGPHARSLPAVFFFQNRSSTSMPIGKGALC